MITTHGYIKHGWLRCAACRYQAGESLGIYLAILAFTAKLRLVGLTEFGAGFYAGWSRFKRT